MIRPAEALRRSDTAKGILKRWSSFRFLHRLPCRDPERQEVCPILSNTVRSRARTDKVTLRCSMARPNDQRRKPQGKMDWPRLTAAKSGKKKRRALIRPHHCRIVQLQGMPCSRKS